MPDITLVIAPLTHLQPGTTCAVIPEDKVEAVLKTGGRTRVGAALHVLYAR